MDAKNDIEHIEIHEQSEQTTKIQPREAHLAAEEEHNTTFLQAIKLYPKACFWSAVVSLCIVMDGYDLALIGSLFGFPAFQKKYGHEIGDTGKYTLVARWQVALGLANSLGNCFGIAINGIISERFGHRKVLLGTLIFLSGLIFIQFFAPSVEVLFVGQILCGLPWGVFTTTAPAYASEVVPLILRSYLETWVVCCWGIGQFVSYAVLFSLNKNSSEWAYRIPFAVQWVWPVIIFPLVWFCPESPWWFVRHGKIENAEKSVYRLYSAKDSQTAQVQTKSIVALMVETDKLEKEMGESTSYKDCFTGSNLWRTEISIGSWTIQVFSSFVIQSYATYFFQQAGLSANDSFKMTLGQGAIHLVSNLASIALTGNYGRRTLYLFGLTSMGTLMFIIGFLSLADHTSGVGFAQSAVYLVWFSVYCLTVGPLAYITVGEASSTRLRSKTIAVARIAYNVIAIINNVVAPYVLNPENGNWKGKAGFLTGGLSVCGLVWVYLRLPELRGRTFEELDILFGEKKITARQFKQASVDVDSKTVGGLKVD